MGTTNVGRVSSVETWSQGRLVVLGVVGTALVAYLGIASTLLGRRSDKAGRIVWALLCADAMLAAYRTASWLALVFDPKFGPLFYDRIPPQGWHILISQTVQSFVMWALV